ncbi:MarR family winged helix-turn-helix transcriptional regulator [Streptomyces sp. NPDC048182]|uniref:MarR family winged helix-turn-helix transcriptional regulator n=1 Tax=unclassified Streptomyces TaxID=2593676 RepID=UPI0033B19723
MQPSDALALSTALLAAAGDLTRRVHDGVVARGFEDLRPAHGFAFARLAPGDATATDLAVHLGVTKQAAGQLVDELVRKGYVERRPHPADARARLVVLTERGRACTRAADEAAAEAVGAWAAVLGEDEVRALADRLLRLAPGGPIRPTW